MLPWKKIADAAAPDGVPLTLQKRGDEFLIRAAGRDLMSSLDDGSSRALASLGCRHISPSAPARVLVGGLGMGFTLAEVLRSVGPRATVEVAELAPAVVEWNRAQLGDLAGKPLDDPRTELSICDVAEAISRRPGWWDAILLDVDNGPCALAHQTNQSLYGGSGLARAYRALRRGGMFAVWSFGDDRAFTKRLEQRGFDVAVERVEGSRKGRGRRHVIWLARKPSDPRRRRSKGFGGG